MKRVLIWDKNANLSNTGGPAGYMWNIKHYLQNHPMIEISFYSDEKGDKTYNSKLNRFYPIRILSFILRKCGLNIFSRILSTYFPKETLTKNEKDIIKRFDYVHFHNIAFINAYGKTIKKLGVKTILTTHSPEVIIDELFSTKAKAQKFIKRHGYFRKYFIQQEKKALEKADFLMYPVPQITDCYTDSQSKDIGEFILSNPQKIFYVPTGIVDSEKIREKTNPYLECFEFPIGAIKICYIGRHNEVKGYPYLKQIATEILKKRRDIYFVIGGQQSEISPLNDPNWIELGWVNSEQLLNEIDIFILPNQNTYFDLIALEIFRAGIPLVTTPNGGNQYLASLKNTGIQFIPRNNAKEAAKEILKYIDSDFRGSRTLNRQLYVKYFSMPTYINNYVSSIQNLL